jgi:hypothetical protein
MSELFLGACLPMRVDPWFWEEDSEEEGEE